MVEVYYDCACVELQLNGKTVGKAKPKGCRAIFKVKYAPGTLTAIVYGADGRELSRHTLTSAETTEVRVLPEKTAVTPGEIVYVPIVIADKKGVVESNADMKLAVSVTGGELLGFGSANPRTEERFDAGSYTTYYGRSLAVVKAGDVGRVVINVNSVSAAIAIE